MHDRELGVGSFGGDLGGVGGDLGGVAHAASALSWREAQPGVKTSDKVVSALSK